MDNSSLDPALVDQLKKLQQKYAVMGQDLSSYLDGLLHADYLTYWDYIHLDTLLSLQNPKTQFPDEKVFIIYHQITELYFNLVLWEIEQIAEKDNIDEKFFLDRLTRIVLPNQWTQLRAAHAQHLVGIVEDEVEPPVGMAIERIVRGALKKGVGTDHDVVEGEKAKVRVDVET